MSLVEIARYQDVYEADLAAAFLASHGVEVDVTERFQTTVDPLMQRALGLRLMDGLIRRTRLATFWRGFGRASSRLTTKTT